MNEWFGLFNDPSKFGRLPDPPEPIEEENLRPEVGDWLECRDKYDMVDTMMKLADEDIEAEYRYKKDGKFGYWLEVVAVDS